jgi:hypothetical protein
MKHAEQQILVLAKKIMKDINYKYLENVPIKIWYEDNLGTIVNKIILHGWVAAVNVEENQFNNGEYGSIYINFDDETGEPVSLEDTSMSRPIPQLLKKDSDGKYYREIFKG